MSVTDERTDLPAPPSGPAPVAPWRENWHYFIGTRGAVVGLLTGDWLGSLTTG